MNAVHTITLFADPADPAAWAASRWLASVEQARPIVLDFTMAPSDAGRGAARVALAAAELVGADGVRAVYEAYGRRRHVLGESDDFTAMRGALEDVQLPRFLAFAAEDAKWDDQLAPASDAPLVINGVPHPLPDLAEVPVGADATALLDRYLG